MTDKADAAHDGQLGTCDRSDYPHRRNQIGTCVNFVAFANYMVSIGEGICFAHGPFKNPDKSIYCPKWPACTTDPQKDEYKAMGMKQIARSPLDLVSSQHDEGVHVVDPDDAEPTPRERKPMSLDQPRIYAASRANLPERVTIWHHLRNRGVSIVSTWIDEAKPGATADLSELWERIADEISWADRLVLYVEPEDFPLKGALIEVGMALALELPVFVVAPGCKFEPPNYRPIGSWIRHPLVTICEMDEACNLTSAPKPATAPAEPVQPEPVTVHITETVCVACGGQVRRFNNVWKHVRPAEYSPCSRYPYAESAPAPATAPPITGAMIVELMDEHETNYVQKMERRWEWSCACGENQWFHEREFAVMMTRSHWADEIMKLLRVTSAPSAAVKEEK
jgi:hypothetical protein